MDKEHILEIFCEALEGGAAYRKTFRLICADIGVSEERMDRILRDSMGFSGPEIVNSYKIDVPVLFL